MMTEYSSLNSKIRAQDFHASSLCNFGYSENQLGSSNNSHNSETFYNSTNSNSMMNSTPANSNLNGPYHYNELMGQVVNSSERENLIFSSFYNVANIAQQNPQSNEFSHQLHQQQPHQQNINYIITNANGYGFNNSTNVSASQNSLYESQSPWNHFANENQLKKSPLQIAGNNIFMKNMHF